MLYNDMTINDIEISIYINGKYKTWDTSFRVIIAITITIITITMHRGIETYMFHAYTSITIIKKIRKFYLITIFLLKKLPRFIFRFVES